MFEGTVPLDFAIVGAQRGGSTHFSHALGHNPALHIPALELPLFEEPFFSNSTEDDVRHHLAPRAGQLLGLKRPDMLGLPGTAARLRSTSDARQVFAVLRDPVDRCISAIYWYMYGGRLPVTPPNDVIDVLVGRTDAMREESEQLHQLGAFSRYGAGLRQYEDAFGRDAVALYFHDDIRVGEGMRAALVDAAARLGVPPSTTPKRTRINAGVYDLRRLRFLRARLPFTFEWTKEQRMRPIGHRHTDRPLATVANAGVHAVDRLVLRHVWRGSQPEVDDSQRRVLVDHFRADVADLASRWDIPDTWRRRYGI